MIELDIKTCQKCYHPCHCGEDNDLHADEYGVCTCEGCECLKPKTLDEDSFNGE
jgi:hypothetical protein|tara:strand:+ start:66 stop:227 length:162 start_codon:yes stop_codon:yes gene_type:complete